MLDSNGCPIHPPVSVPKPPEAGSKKTGSCARDPDFAPELALPVASTLLPGPRIVLRVTPEYHDWARGLSDHLGGLSITQAVDQGLRRLAEVSGFRSPPRRYEPSNPSRSRRPPIVP